MYTMGSQGDLEKIKKQLNHGGDHFVLQGPLLKRSDTIRKWNSRWFTLDVSTVKLEYRSHRGDKSPRGVVNFDAESTIAVCPQNIMKERNYDGCCFYISTSQKKDYFCAETPEAARAWVATLRAAISVHKAQREAVNLLSGNGQAKLATVASVVAAANVTAKEAAKSLQLSMKSAASGASSSQKKSKQTGPIMGDFELMQETIRVKEEEIHQLAMDLKSRDCTIKELSDRLTESMDTAEASAATVRGADKECKQALSEVDHLRQQLVQAVQQIRVADAQITAALKVEETAFQEAHRCRLELGKLRERGVILEGAMMRVEEDIRRLKVEHEQEIMERLQPQPARIESRLPVEEEPFEDTPGAEEIALVKPTRGPLEGEFMALEAKRDIASTSEFFAAVGASEENITPILTCEHSLTHDATTLSKTDISGCVLNGMKLIENDPGPNGGAPSIRDESSLSQLEIANTIVHESVDLKHATASDVLISEDTDNIFKAAHLAESVDELPKESDCILSFHNNGEDKDGEEEEKEEKETDVYCGETGDTLLEEPEELHVAEESHELVTSYQSSYEESVTIDEEPHRREAHFRLCCF